MQTLFQRSLAHGQTDITGALQFAFNSIRAARGRDPHLERAKVVLITDGEDRVRLEEVRQARAGAQVARIALSFISLGEENPDLRALAEEQRRQGERAFFYHLTDYEIGAVRTEFDRRFRTLLPPDVRAQPAPLTSLDPQLAALEALVTNRPVKPRPPSAASFDALFPKAPSASGERLPEDAVERVRDALGVVAEMLPLSVPDVRAQDAVDLLLHLLSVYEMDVPRYLACLGVAALGSGTGAQRTREIVQRIRLLARPLAQSR
jgi:hypothetical protein